MSQVSDPEPWREDILKTINTAMQAATAEMIAHFDQRHDALTTRLKQLEVEVAALRRQGNDARRQNSLADMLVQQMLAMMGQAPEMPLPESGTAVPVEVEEACAADPAVGTQRVDLTEYGTVAYLRPGTDPVQAWNDIQETLTSKEGPRETRRLRRARQH